MLIRTLRDTDERLEELTGGEVDTVTDQEGRLFLLQRAQDWWRQSGSNRQAAILDAMPAQVVLLDARGVIVSANEAWRTAATRAGGDDAPHFIGRNYLTVCDEAVGDGAEEARTVAAGIRSVAAGTEPHFFFEYPCHSAFERRWHALTVTPVGDRPGGVVVMHIDVTDRRQSEEQVSRFANAMDATPDGIYLIDRADMRFVHVNEAAYRMHGLTREELLSMHPWEVLNNSRTDLESNYDALILDGGCAEPEEVLLERKDGQPFWIEIRRLARYIGGRWTIVVLVRDVTLRKEAERRINHLNRVHAVLSGINTLIVRVKSREELFREACRIAVDHGALAMTWIGMVDPASNKVVPVASAGVTDELLAAITARLVCNSVDAPGNSLPTLMIREKTVFVSNDSQHDPRVNFAEMHVKFAIRSMAMFPMNVGDEAVGILVMCASEKGFFDEEQLRLLTELTGDVAFAVAQIAKQDRLDYLAYYDDLTGLANRTLFLERAAQYARIATDGEHKLALCLIDLERFKNINDSLGRPVGDSLLRQLAVWLTGQTGDASLIARIDGDHFAMVIPSVRNEAEVARILERTLDAFSNHSFRLNDADYRLAAKIGVAILPEDGRDAETLLKHAEVALKKAQAGGGKYLFYAQKMTESVSLRVNLENRLRRALELDEYVLHYQPKIDAANGQLAGVEALIRWNDPLTGLVPPGRFIPVLEETGLIHEVGRWALNRAVKDYLMWRTLGLPVVRVAVNLSALQLQHRDFVAEVRRIVGVDPYAAAGLELEITESLIMQDVNLSIANLHAVRSMGVRVAIDDFGTGFSSLSYLSKLPVDSLKIDRSFTEEMVKGKGGLKLVSVIINLAHSLKLTVVGEGVETHRQSRALRLLKCNEMQGFYFSKPLPAADFAEKFLVARHRFLPRQV